MLAKAPPLFGRMRDVVRRQMTLIGILIGQFLHQPYNNFPEGSKRAHTSSGRRRVVTNGDSITLLSRVPRRMPLQRIRESTRIAVTKTRNTPHTIASS